MQPPDLIRLAATFALALTLSYGTIALLQPLWRNYAVAKPNARSSHKQPTPQGGGIAVLLAFACALVFIPPTLTLYAACAAALVLGALGALDDLHTLDPTPRLVLQALAVSGTIALLPAEFHVFSSLPAWFERALLAIGLLWFVNLTNFMDGIDWMTAAEMVPLTGALALCGLAGALPADAALAAAALCGALMGFAPFNRPVARLFLGDVGSLPIGLLAGWLLIRLGDRHLAAAVLLPLYYVLDATITLIRRYMRGESVMQAHRQHFYQQAVDNGLEVKAVIARVMLLNLILIALAAICIAIPSLAVHLAMLAAGCAAIGATLWSFASAKRP
ncbi:MAG TPA: glycosyltransferase family 4 protein [Pseudolabrys sp.]|nr:glycosyltransferase family 4 protein [Pseudolabrys sp.]